MKAVLLSLLLTILLGSVAEAQDLSITFQVNLSYQVEIGRFDPQTESVDVAGTFNNWGSGTRTDLTDSDGDLVYEVTLHGFSVGQTIEYKFRFNGVWDGREEFPGAGNNRRYTVQAGENVISVWYNDEVSPNAPLAADFQATSTDVMEGGMVFFEDRSTGRIDTWSWIFEGGLPATSTEQDPAVRYAMPGSYDVTLIVSNAEDADTLTLHDFIRVRERDTTSISWWNHTVFYELFVRSFYDSDGDGIGDFNGIVEKLDYLNDGDPKTDTDLGITGIWLMPIHPSPSYHGYDVTDYRSVNPEYGTMDDFRRFLDEAHRRGIRVIIDYVMNHSSSEHPWFQKSAQRDPLYRDFYRWSDVPRSEAGPWGQELWHRGTSGYYYGLFWSGMPDLNYENPAVKDSIFAAAAFWLDEVGVDGFRLDAVKYLFETDKGLENVEETYRLWADFSQHVKSVKPDAFTVCEAWDATPVAARYVYDGQIDFCFEFDLAGRIIDAVRNGDARTLATRMEEIYHTYPYLQYGTFLTNHDQNRVIFELGQDVDRAKAAAALYLTLPGIPYVYYGEEIGMTGTKPDPMIRRPMQWTAERNAGFTTGNPWQAPDANYTTRNVAAQHSDPGSLLSWYRTLIGIRNREAALRVGSYHSVISSAAPVMAFARRHGENVLLVLVNTSDETVNNLTLGLPPDPDGSTGYTLVDLIRGDSLHVALDAGHTLSGLSIPGLEIRIYRLVPSGETTSTENPGPVAEGVVLEQNFPNPARGLTTIRFTLPTTGPVRVELFDLLGRRIGILADGTFPAGTHNVSLDVSKLPSGTYFYRLHHADGQISKRMVVN